MTKANTQNETGINTSEFAKKTNLSNLKSNVDELDIDKIKNVTSGLSSLKSKVDKSDIGKLETTPDDLSKLSDVIKNDVVKRIEHGELVKKVDNIKTTDTSDLVKKAEYDTKIGKIEKKILDHNHDKYVTTLKFNKLMLDNLPARLNQANLASEMIFLNL